MTKTEQLKMDNLFKAFLKLSDVGDARTFLPKLLTPGELKDISNRWFTVRLLDAGLHYEEIESLTKMSAATIAKMSKALNCGDGAFGLILNRFNKDINLKASLLHMVKEIEQAQITGMDKEIYPEPIDSRPVKYGKKSVVRS